MSSRASRLWRRCRAAPAARLNGRALGTTYTITIVNPPADTAALHERAGRAMQRVESLMSIYRADSEICRFNAATHTDWQPLSCQTIAVVRRAIEIGRYCGGAYDITSLPLVQLWGFGSADRAGKIPDPAQIELARQHVGQDRIEIHPDTPALRKLDPAVAIDLGSIAKGYAVDEVVEQLQSAGIADLCVELGGEVRVAGANAAGRPWRIAIESPDAPSRTAHRLVRLRRGAIATSGDYRQFIEHLGQRYTHLIDPRTGWPVDHDLAAVTVLAPTCMEADAWATALLVAGPNDGLRLAQQQGIPAMFLTRQHNSGFAQQTTHGFAEHL